MDRARRPGLPADKPPDYTRPRARAGRGRVAGTDPFIMQADGQGLAVRAGRARRRAAARPLRARTSRPFDNPLYGQQANPVRGALPPRVTTPTHPARSTVFPYVFTTYRLTEHHTAGGMSRFLPYLSELQPEFFCEVSPELAAERGLEHLRLGDRRDRPHRDRGAGAGHRADAAADGAWPYGAPGRAALPLGPNGLSTGDAANELLPAVLDPNVHIQESKAATCDIQPGRRPRGPDLLRLRRAATAGAPASGRKGHERPARRDHDPPPAPGTPPRRRGWASSPTPACASGARRARWRARSGTRCRPTG